MARDEDGVATVGDRHAEEAVKGDLEVTELELVEVPLESVVVVGETLPDEALGVVDVLGAVRSGGVNLVVLVSGVEENDDARGGQGRDRTGRAIVQSKV